MPFTFLAHQAPVVPLKLVRPAWFSGVALVIGSMSPDFEYFLRGEPISTLSHTLAGQLVFCLPMTVLLVLLVERVLAPTLPGHLPELGPFHVRDFAALSNTRRSVTGWLKVTASAVVGSISHVFWDGFTHGHGWAVAQLAILGKPVLVVFGHEVPAYKLVQHGSTLVGAGVTLGLLLVIGRRRLVVTWRGPVAGPQKPRSGTYALLCAPALGAGIAGAVLAIATGERDGNALGIVVCALLRATSFAFVGLCFGAVMARRAAVPLRAVA